MIPTKAKRSYLLHHIPNQWLLLPVELKRCHLSKKRSFSPYWQLSLRSRQNGTSEKTQHGDKRTCARLSDAGGWAAGLSAAGWAYPEDLFCLKRWREKPDRTRAAVLRPRNRRCQLYIPPSVYLWAPKLVLQQQTLLASLTAHDKCSQRIRLVSAARGLIACHLHFTKVLLRKSRRCTFR